MMKKFYYLALFSLFMAMTVMVGCSQKSVLREEKAIPQGSVMMDQSAVESSPAESSANMKSSENAVDEAAKAMQEEQKTAGQKTAEQQTSQQQKEMMQKMQEEKAAQDMAEAGNGLSELVDIHFDYNSYGLTDEARDLLKEHAEWLNNNKNVMVVVEGHCDERGTAEYNLALGERRAKAAAKFLANLGLGEKRIKTISYGEELPLAPGHNEEAWAKNRRVHFVVSGK